MTLYRIYEENGNRAGFWVQHRSWSNICAHVRSIAGQESGRLPGHAPLYDDQVDISIEYFDVRSGRPSEVHSTVEHRVDRNFVTIAQPSWYSGTTAVR